MALPNWLGQPFSIRDHIRLLRLYIIIEASFPLFNEMKYKNL